MRRLLSVSAFVSIFGLAVASAASAQQSFNFSIGGFLPRGNQLSDGTVTGRTEADVLASNSTFLDFNFHDFRGATVGGEWLVALGDKFDVGLGIGYYSKSTPTVYFDFTNADGSEIEHDLNLRIVPFTATVRFLPLGHHDSFVPYIGAGVGVYSWHYSETGQFLATDNTVFRDTFTGSGSAAGPVILGGIRLPLGSVEPGFEVKWQSAHANLPSDIFTDPFGGPQRIDLGGVNYLFTLNFRF
jgi:outer membrane protein W